MWDEWHVANQNHGKKGQVLVQANKFLYTEMEAVTIHSCHHENPLTIRKQHMNSNITIIKTDGTVTANLLQHKKRTHTCTHISIK